MVIPLEKPGGSQGILRCTACGNLGEYLMEHHTLCGPCLEVERAAEALKQDRTSKLDKPWEQPYFVKLSEPGKWLFERKHWEPL